MYTHAVQVILFCEIRLANFDPIELIFLKRSVWWSIKHPLKNCRLYFVAIEIEIRKTNQTLHSVNRSGIPATHSKMFHSVSVENYQNIIEAPCNNKFLWLIVKSRYDRQSVFTASHRCTKRFIVNGVVRDLFHSPKVDRLGCSHLQFLGCPCPV